MDEVIRKEIEFLVRALELLRSEQNWTKTGEFDDECLDTNPPYNLGCALKIAQREIKGIYESRSKGMNALRWIIYRHFLCRAKHHPIYYFNKNKNTKHSEIIVVLQKAIQNLNT